MLLIQSFALTDLRAHGREAITFYDYYVCMSPCECAPLRSRDTARSMHFLALYQNESTFDSMSIVPECSNFDGLDGAVGF